MILEIIITIIAGIFLGILAGLIPGIHINLISSLLILGLPVFLKFLSPFSLVIFIISMTITTVFLDFIPSTYFGAPEEETALSILPAHEMLMKGKANTAVYLSSIGSFIGIFISFLLIPLFLIFLNRTYPFFEKMMFFILIWIAILLLINNKNIKLVLLISTLAGFLGISSLNLEINQPLLPLFTGLFGVSGLIFSINQKAEIPEQDKEVEKQRIKFFIKPTIISACISPLCSFLPGLGSSQAVIIGSKAAGELNRKQFLVTNGMINILVSILSIITLTVIGKSRTGSAAIISQIFEISKIDMLKIIPIILIVGFISFIFTNLISKIVSNKIDKLNYKKISLFLIVFLTTIVFFITGFKGILVLAVSTCLGLSCHYSGTPKNILMFCLLIPTILYYWPF